LLDPLQDHSFAERKGSRKVAVGLSIFNRQSNAQGRRFTLPIVTEDAAIGTMTQVVESGAGSTATDVKTDEADRAVSQ
jgi:hypothetical protein